jgi:cell division septation protein DedD
MSKTPGAANIPILGALFKSKNVNHSTTELVVIVTPTLVDPLTETGEPAQPDLPIPTLNSGKFDKSLGKDLNPHPSAPPINPEQLPVSNPAPAATSSSAPAATPSPAPVAVPVADTAQNATPAQAHHGTAAPTASNPEKGSAGSAASKAALGKPATHESGNSVAGAPSSGIVAPPVVATPESPRRYVFDNPTATPSTGGKAAVEPDTPSRSMVQIMTLANKDDAESMAAALKRHGYNVAVNHDPQDSLLHLEVGPFASKTDAEAMRQRLLSDGYNASVR